MRVALDAMGGDHAPGPNIQGAVTATQANSDLQISLVGEEDVLKKCLADAGNPERISIVASEGVVGMDEKPTVALRAKPNSSIAVCWKLMAERNVDAIVSAGNTGAVVAAGLRTRLFLKGVKRPGIAVTLPNLKGHSVMIDVGANPAARAEHLVQYGIIGRIYAREVLGVDSPRVGLMNIGSEDGKGNELYQEAHKLLQDCALGSAYIGNVEGRGVYHGEADVLVCEGFVGNVILKVSEGMAEFLMKTAAGALMESLDTEKEIAAGVMKGLVQKFRYQESGGAPLLGIDGNCIICHGSSDSHSINNALGMATKLHDLKLNEQITAALQAAPAEA